MTEIPHNQPIRKNFLHGTPKPLNWPYKHKSYEEVQEALERLRPRITSSQLMQDYPHIFSEKTEQ